MFFALFQVSLLSFCLTTLTSASDGTSSASQVWPLRFHKSEWLEKGFIVRQKEHSLYSDPLESSSSSKPKCDENSQQEYGRSSFSSCQAEGECSYIPSPHCKREIERRRFDRDENETPQSIEKILSHNYINPKTRIRPNKDGRFRQAPEQFEQCHFLTESLITDMCADDRKSVREELIGRLRLRNCRRFALEKALTSELHKQVVDSKNCSNILRELLVLDNLVEELACEYESILQRYDCDAKWSVKWTCRDCRLAYREWLCSVYIPYHLNGVLIKPCQSICEQVEQKCPHLHPYGKGQYAGEPVFLYIDPNIPFNQEITPNIPFGPAEWCYDSCDLEPCLNERGEAPVVQCNYAHSAAISTSTTTTTTPETGDEEQFENVQLFEEELANLGNATSTNDSFSAANADSEAELTGAINAESTTVNLDLEWAKSQDNADSVEAEFDDSLGTTPPPEVTTPFASWSSVDEDYSYVIQNEPVSAAKQLQSVQYLELESPQSAETAGQSEEESSTTENYQEIFQRAISPVTEEATIESEIDLAESDRSNQRPTTAPTSHYRHSHSHRTERGTKPSPSTTTTRTPSAQSLVFSADRASNDSLRLPLPSPQTFLSVLLFTVLFLR